jgi:O-antigen/teichoic acid export membrane protein
MPSIRRSLVLSFAQKYTSLLIGVPSIMLLARFLTPEETGIFSVSIALSNLAHMLRDFGVGDYLIQEHSLNREKLRTAFTITAGMAWLMALGLYLAGPAATDFFGEAGVGQVLSVIALNFVLIPFGSPASALMRRELAYGALYIKDTTEALTRNAASVTLAISGFSYMSLAWGSLAGIAAGTIATAILRPRDVWLRPSLQYCARWSPSGKKSLSSIFSSNSPVTVRRS